MFIITKIATRATFRVRVQPGAGKNEIVGIREGALRIRISTPAVKGKANKALVHFLPRKLGVKNSGVEIITGHTTRLKRIKVIGEGTKKKRKNLTVNDTSILTRSVAAIRGEPSTLCPNPDPRI